MSLESICPLRNKDCENAKRAILEENAATLKKMSPKGALFLHPYLDQKRLEHGIIDAAFDFEPIYDRVFVWQLGFHKGNTYIPGGVIIQPDAYKDADDKSVPQGIVVGAGLGALDALRSHGTDLGHQVAIIAVAPWSMPIEPGSNIGVLMLQAGDLVGSKELARALRSGKCQIKSEKNSEGVRVHKYVDENGETWDPVLPWTRDDT